MQLFLIHFANYLIPPTGYFILFFWIKKTDLLIRIQSTFHNPLMVNNLQNAFQNLCF